MRESSPPNPVNFASRNSRKGTLDDLSKRTGKVLATLTPREEIVLRCRFGIGSDASCTLEELSQKFSLTPNRVREIQLKAFAKLPSDKLRRSIVVLTESIARSPEM